MTNKPSLLSQQTLILSFIFTTGLYILLATYVNYQDNIVWNNTLQQYIQNYNTNALTPLLATITWIGDKRVLFVLLAVVFLWLIYLRHWRTAILWLSNGFICSALIAISKITINITRPEFLIEPSTLGAFPSGHTALSIAVYGFLAFLIAQKLKPPQRYIIYIGFALLISLIIASRLLLHMHWLTDILGGSALGLATLLLSLFLYQRHSQ
ncbi:MAG: phosphatase PAP2 family protein [Gammaproteobacteria bacterium]